jgi:hypothetical protein
MTLAKVAAIALAVSLSAGRCGAQATVGPRPSNNAALRYWMAFAEIQDPPADREIVALLERVISGSAAWDEPRLGHVVEMNMPALEIMQRATRLPECDWGLEYELGPNTPVAHLAKARVLARLNVLYGMRQAARGEVSAAADTWLAGLRFAEHMAQGASLFGALTAKAALLTALTALRRTIPATSLDDASVQRIEQAVRRLPQFGIDWGDAIRVEAAAGTMALEQFARSPDARKSFQEAFSEPLPASVKAPSPAEIAQFQSLMERAARALQQDYVALPELAGLEAKIRSLNPVIDRLMPSLARVNESRRETQLARRELLDVIANRRRH